jgi:hypothetical protein
MLHGISYTPLVVPQISRCQQSDSVTAPLIFQAMLLLMLLEAVVSMGKSGALTSRRTRRLGTPKTLEKP